MGSGEERLEAFFKARENYTSKANDLKTTTKDDVVNKTFGKNSYSVGIETLPRQTENLMAKKGATFNLMLVGESGLGKTTFVNTLFGTTILPNLWSKVEETDRKVKFDKTTSIIHHTAHLVEDNFCLDFSVIDTPGFGDYINNSFGFLPITDYIDEQLRFYMFQEEQPDRSKLADNRVHCCLYFINPTSKGLAPLDIEALKHISSRVNLIPVLTKADSLTSEELLSIKKIIREIIKVQNIKICEFIKEQDVKSNILKHIPFSIINSETSINREDGTTVKGRQYKWGVAEVENPDHCDFVKLKDVLMINNMVDLISSTEAYYENCRTKLMKTRIKQAKQSIVKSESQDDIGELVKNFNYENPDENGINTILLLSKYNKPFVDELVIEWSPIFLQKQQLRRRRFNEIIGHEEKKFKDWKKALFAKQSVLNDEIDADHGLIRLLQRDIHNLRAVSHDKETIQEEKEVVDIKVSVGHSSDTESGDNEENLKKKDDPIINDNEKLKSESKNFE